MNYRSLSINSAIWALLLLTGSAPAVSLEAFGVAIDHETIYRTRLRKTGYDKWDVTLERGTRSAFAETILSSDVPSSQPLLRESVWGFWVSRDRVFLAFRFPVPPDPGDPIELFDYPLFDPARYQGDWAVGEGERNKRGEIRVLSPEESQKHREAFIKAFKEGKVRNPLAEFHGNQRLIFNEIWIGWKLFPGDKIMSSAPDFEKMSPAKSFAFAPQGTDDLQVVMLTTKGDLCTFPCGRTQNSQYAHEDEAMKSLERLDKLPDAERVFISADRHVGVTMPNKLLVYTREPDGWKNTITEEGFAATACIWDWNTDEFLLVDQSGEKFYRLGSTEADKAKTVGRIDDATRQQTLKAAWAITKLPATRPE